MQQPINPFTSMAQEFLGVDLNISPEQLHQGQSVVQDAPNKSSFAPNQIYYFEGTGLAYTTQIRTCTALAIYHAPSQRAYLSHAEAGTKADTITQHVSDYLQHLQQNSQDPYSSQILLYCTHYTYNDTSKGDRSTSLHVTLHALACLLDLPQFAQPELLKLFVHAKYRLIDTDEAYIFVGGGHPPAISLPQNLLRFYVFQSYGQTNTPDLFRPKIKELLPQPHTPEELKALVVAKDGLWEQIENLKVRAATMEDQDLQAYLTPFDLKNLPPPKID